MSETIWSSGSPNSLGGNGANQSYRNVMDQFEPEVSNMLSYNDPIGSDIGSARLSLNDGSEIEGSKFGFKTGALSAITAPVGGFNGNSSPTQGQRLGLGTASISGGIANRHPPQDSFLQKFSGVGDATRDLELASGFGKLELDNSHSSRRTSFNHQEGLKAFSEANNTYSSPTGSLNESLNMPNTRTSRHQSISDKIDQYNNASPIQANATLSINSDLNAKDDRSGNQKNIWNPAAAAAFNPSGYPQFPNGEMYGMGNMMPNQFNPYARPNGVNMNPISPPPFMFSSTPAAFMDPRLVYNMSSYPMNGNGNGYPNSDSNNSSYNTVNDQGDNQEQGAAPEGESTEGKGDASPQQNSRKDYVHTPGIGMPRPNGRFVFQPFNPYNVYQQSPTPMNVVIQSTDAEATTEKPKVSSPTAPASEEPATVNTPTNTNSSRKKNGGSKANNGGKGAPHIYRSPLLEEVRSNFKGKEYYLKDIYGHAIEFTKDQHGSRFIQQKLPSATDEEKEVIFNEIRPISYELMTDVFGNYVIQKYFEHGSKTQKLVLLENMLGHIYELSLQMYGCRVVQRALEAIELDGQVKIITELQNHILICAKDQNGNHVIQKSIERIPFDRVRFILESLENQIYHLSTHPYGCRVIQRLLEHSDDDDQQKILGELNRFIFYLIQDQYGNYVMQHILERGREEDREAILVVVLGSVVNFSKHKFASNVIEKCIKFGSDEQRKRILHEVLLNNEDLSIEVVEDDSPLALMMKDQYANYVIQKLVEGFDTKSEEKRLLVMKLRQYLKQISSKNSYGKHLASVEKMIIVAETALVEADNS